MSSEQKNPLCASAQDIEWNSRKLTEIILKETILYLNQQQKKSILTIPTIHSQLKLMMVNKFLADRGQSVQTVRSEVRKLSDRAFQYALMERLVERTIKGTLPGEITELWMDHILDSEQSPFICSVMQKNEGYLLLHWAFYHAQIVGYENLLIFDNGSTDSLTIKILNLLNGMGVSIVYYYDDITSYNNKGNIIFKETKRITNAKNSIALLDIDEFLFCQCNDRVSFDPDTIRRELVVINSSMSFSNPVLRNEVGYSAIPGSYNVTCGAGLKALVHSSWPLNVQQGYHFYNYSKRQDVPYHLPSQCSIGYLHFHLRPYKYRVRTAKEILAPLVDINDIEKLKNYTGGAFHLKKFILEGEEEYSQLINRLNNEANRNIEQEWQACGLPYPFIEPYIYE